MALTPKERMAIERQRMPERAPDVRNRDFKEVNLGFQEEIARREATRCLQCKDRKCVAGCPVGIDIPGFLDKIVAGDLDGAARLLLDANALPGITGRVCRRRSSASRCASAPRARTASPSRSATSNALSPTGPASTSI